MGKSLFLIGVLLGLPGLAKDTACVRNFMNDQGLIPCNAMPQQFAYVVPAKDSEGVVCTRAYAEMYCHQAPHEYVKAISEEGKEICVLENDQPGVVNMCAASPKLFTYIKLKP